MALLELVKRKKTAIAQRWLERTLQTYPADAAAFFKQKRDPFANPVGQRLARGIEELFDALVEGRSPQQQCEALDPIIQLRVVQEFTPAQALVFVFELKGALRQELAGEMDEPGVRADLMEFETRIDQLALFAFDIFTRYRQRTYEIRVDEIKRQVAGLMRRSGMFVDGAEE